MRGRDITDHVYLVAKELISVHGHVPIRDLDAPHLAPIIARWRRDYAKNTQHNRTKALRRILRDLSPLTGKPLHQCVPRIGEPKPPQQVVTAEQRAALLRVAPQWLRLFILLCADTAFRFSEAMRAKLSGYNRENRTITVPTKSGQDVTLPVTEELRVLIESIPADGDPNESMVTKLRGKEVDKWTIRYQWNRAKKRAGVPAHVRPHDFRRTAATSIWETTHDIRLVQQVLGHKSLQATARYIVDRSPEQLRPLLEALKPATELKQ